MASPQDTIREAVAEHRSGNFTKAERLYSSVLQREPTNFVALHMLGVVALQTGRFGEAERLIAQARRIDPESALACVNHGNALQRLERFAEAVGCYDSAVALAPDLAEAWSNRGNALRALGNPEEALNSFEHAVALNPRYARAWSNRSLSLMDCSRTTEALASCDRALEIDPTFADAHSNRGIALHALGRFEEGLSSIEHALALRPDFPEALSHRGCCLKELTRFDEALDSFTAALQLKPDYVDARYNRGMALLLRGAMAEGWADYEHRPTGPYRRVGYPALTAPFWTGEPVGGKRILVLSEQGMGDTIQFARYVQLLAERCAAVSFVVPAQLSALFEPFRSTINVVTEVDERRVDFALPVMSLPRLLGIGCHEVPTLVPYLFAEASRIERWRRVIGDAGFKIGISWQGNPLSRADRGRSFPVQLFSRLAGIEGVRLISLQKGPGAEQLDRLPASIRVETLGDDFDSGPDAFLDSGAVLNVLDLLITCDTALGHLAGALGRPVWIALKAVPHWVWGMESRQSLWYPTARLFRQSVPGEWNSVFASIGRELHSLMQDRR